MDRRDSEDPVGGAVERGSAPEDLRDEELAPVDPRLRLLDGKDARAILARIVPDDPLQLEELAHERIHQLVVFMSAARVRRRSQARVAHDAVADPRAGRPSLHGWLVACVDRSIRELVREDDQTLRRGQPFDDEDEGYYAAFSAATGIGAERARETCIRFNLLDPITRDAFYCVAFEEQPLAMYARSLGESIADVEHRIAIASRLFVAAEQDEEGPHVD